MKKKWVKHFRSFLKAEQSDKKSDKALSPTKKLELVQILRETYSKIRGKKKNDSRAGLRGFVKIIQQT